MRFGTCTAVGVVGESAEIICFGCSRGPPSFRALVLLDFSLSSKHTRKRNEIRTSKFVFYRKTVRNPLQYNWCNKPKLQVPCLEPGWVGRQQPLPTTRLCLSLPLPNSLMHDTDEHNFYVWQPHCRRMEYV